ncbi:hypothetical protein HK101_010610 [Irineochytrium annulatum]|nr:hypothetical protein HK101_010610 [Irineochytrium annulatum]
MRRISMKPFTPSNPRPVATFSLQPTLPRLPIPPLEETLARYLKSIQPIATAQDYERNVAFVRDFLKPGGLGHELQARLIEYDRSQTGSWLEKWWLQLAYHGWRDSCLINSNWYMIVDTPPEDVRDIVDKMDRDLNARTFTSFQLKRAAGIITRFLDYKDMLDNETLPIEMTRQGPLCMDQYRRVYGITRVPKRGCDVNVGQHPFHSRYIVVCVRDQFYKVDVIGKDGSRITLEAIEK